MNKSRVTEYILAYMQEKGISASEISEQTQVPEEKLHPDYKEPLLAEEFLEIIDSDCTAAQLRNEWEEKSKIFTVLLPHEQVEDIETIIESLEPIYESSDEIYQSERAKLKYKMEVLKESMQVNIENIF